MVVMVIGLGAFTIARQTLDTMGYDLTELPLAAALIVKVMSVNLVTFLSVLGIHASFIIIGPLSIVSLGWGRATCMATTLKPHEGTPPDALPSEHSLP